MQEVSQEVDKLASVYGDIFEKSYVNCGDHLRDVLTTTQGLLHIKLKTMPKRECYKNKTYCGITQQSF